MEARTRRVNVRVNGKEYQKEVEPRLLLVHFIRDVLGLTGTHIGCETTKCGACTVLLNGRSIKSCTMFAVQAEGAEITTIEGLGAEGELHPLQEAFRQHHGLQCGYCTPGFVMRGVEFLRESPAPTEDEIREGITGNLCRCTGYQNIVKAINSVAEMMEKTSRKKIPV